MYSDKTIKHFICPQNAYTMSDTDAEGSSVDTSCGDYLSVYIKVKDGILTEVSYLVFGCSASIATSSMKSVMARGKTINEALIIKKKEVADALGGLSYEKIHFSNIGLNALKMPLITI